VSKEEKSPVAAPRSEGVDESLAYECMYQQDTSAVNIKMEVGDAGNDAGAKESAGSKQDPTNNSLLHTPPRVDRKLNFDNDDFSSSLCKVSFRSRAVDVTTVYKGEKEEVVEDKIHLAKAKQRAFDIARRVRSGDAPKKEVQKKDVKAKKQKNLSSLRKNLFGKNSHSDDVKDANDATHATADVTNEASMLCLSCRD